MRSRQSASRTGVRPAAVHVVDPVAGSATSHAGAGGLAELAGRNGVAAEHLADGRPHSAVIVLEALLNDCRLLLGEEHPETLVVEGNLAVAYVMFGQEEAGAQLMLANLVARERVFGDEHALTLTARDAVATTHRLAGRLPEALWLYSRVASQRNRVLGPSHPDTLTTRLGLGLTFAEAGDTAVARDLVTAALQDCDQACAEHAAMLGSCLADLRRVRFRAGHPPHRGVAARQ
jgi:Tetratricopeptide repeat